MSSKPTRTDAITVTFLSTSRAAAVSTGPQPQLQRTNLVAPVATLQAKIGTHEGAWEVARHVADWGHESHE